MPKVSLQDHLEIRSEMTSPASLYEGLVIYLNCEKIEVLTGWKVSDQDLIVIRASYPNGVSFTIESSHPDYSAIKETLSKIKAIPKAEAYSRYYNHCTS